MTRTASSWLRQVRRADDDTRSEGEEGFTLIEMLVVITIIGLVMALVGPRVLNYLGESKVKAAKIQIESFSAALDLYFLDNGTYPTASEGLGALVQRPSSTPAWNGPYLKLPSPLPSAIYRLPTTVSPKWVRIGFGPGTVLCFQ